MKGVLSCLLVFACVISTVKGQTNPCPPCKSGQTPMAGHGAASNWPGCNCAGDNRRVITVQISSGWDDPPGSHQTNANI
jgi:hypothetical protein